MELKFDANQEYQIAAIESVARVFEGQPLQTVDFSSLAEAFGAVGNSLDLAQDALLENVRRAQADNKLPLADELAYITEKIQAHEGEREHEFLNLSIEMETGTGKTYVYLRTILELYTRYGWRKFIVVVPSIAVREGVLKTLNITRRHFSELYGNTPYRYYVYNSENLSQVRQFATSANVEIMLMTIDSFNKASNVIRNATDRLQGETPIHLIQAARPILILDEPQNMESEKSIAALARLQPLFALRYSATHRNPYTNIFRLTPFEAYRQRLVKRINVASVLKEDDANQAFIRVEKIDAKKNTLTARIAIHQLLKDGKVKEKVVTINRQSSLEELSGRREYDGFTVDEINHGAGFVRFSNNIEIPLGEARGADREAIFEAQIHYTIEEHFRQQKRLKPHGIKVLSLFFIDRVANYANEDGILRRLFVKCFDELKTKHDEWRECKVEDVQAAYFARKRAKGAIEFVDTVSGKTKEDEAAYDLIMRDKERLLSFENRVAFIFSHSALREGWDNPNIFQICTLNQTVSEAKKRQEIGRGVRLAVNQTGARVHDEKINQLVVVANESYQNYVAKLQAEIVEEYGADGAPPPPANARERGTARLRKGLLLAPEFIALWEKIKHKTRYSVRVDEARLIDEVMPELDKIEVRPPRVTIKKAQLQVEAEDEYQAWQLTDGKTSIDLSSSRVFADLLEAIANLMERTTPPMNLTRRTLVEIFRRLENKEAAMKNPFEFATRAVQIIKSKLADHLVDGIEYERTGAWYDMRLIEEDETIDAPLNKLAASRRGIYDYVICDSSVEEKLIEGLDKSDHVKLYMKLPAWFTVTTPIGEYNPDWAIAKESRDAHADADGEHLYLICETKSTKNKNELRADERRKIDCGASHFKSALKVDYELAVSIDDIS